MKLLKETAPDEKGEIEAVSEVKEETPPIADDPTIGWGIPSGELERLQKGYPLCAWILNQIDKQGKRPFILTTRRKVF